ncbi:hypothetical protein [Mangrovimonas sp. YM274]|uniref:hypothetical protein n=1 Tax=Mangrovimonas sp. YM274 TaxID=3070660 RepID=UPI0027DB00F2|nr:hypothetical protein [Mangrovimonas sp. YM274]WMI68015.1 hypothetical protein RBH95_12780 [Mangrovimonas sp. YM274]
MKNIKFLILMLFSLSMVVSCIDDDNDELTGGASTGGLITLNNAAIGYVVGNGATYTASGSVYQGNTKTVNIDIYKSFTSSATGNSTEEILYDSVEITETDLGTNAPFSTSFTYEDLIEGLTLDGSPLPASDSELNIGDFWTLRYEATLDTGEVFASAASTKVSVGTRFAGLYRCLEAEYYRIGVLTYTASDWPSETTIESVDATTYRVVEYFGAFNGNEWYFQIDENDKITYPDETPSGDAQNGNGQPLITCESSPADMSNVPCGAETNIVVRDEVNGEDLLYMSFGYYTSGSGSREFYQVMEKIVE